MTTENQTPTTSGNSLFTKLALSVVGTVVTYYVTQWTNKKLQEKPLKTRIREGKEKIVDIKDQAKEKAVSVATAAKIKLDDKATALNALIQEKKDVVNDKIDDVVEDAQK